MAGMAFFQLAYMCVGQQVTAKGQFACGPATGEGFVFGLVGEGLGCWWGGVRWGLEAGHFTLSQSASWEL